MRVQLEVDESRVDEWDAYVEDHEEVSSRSDLIRTSVERTISDSSSVETTEEIKPILSDLIDQHERILDDIQDTRESVLAVQSMTVEKDDIRTLLEMTQKDIERVISERY